MSEPEYEPESDAAWDIRVARGVQLLDEASVSFSWRDRLADLPSQAFDFGVDVITLLCDNTLGGVEMCRSALAHYSMQTYGLDLFSVGLDYAGEYGDPEFEALHRAWVRYLEADAAAQLADAA